MFCISVVFKNYLRIISYRLHATLVLQKTSVHPIGHTLICESTNISIFLPDNYALFGGEVHCVIFGDTEGLVEVLDVAQCGIYTPATE